MAPTRNPPFPLVIICLVFIRGYCPLPTPARVTEMQPMRPLRPRGFSTEDLSLPPDDYYDGEDTVTTILPSRLSPDGRTFPRCDYNPCLESDTTCADLAASTGCLCPGFTLHNIAPEMPDLKAVTWNGSEVVLQWCAPYSYVTAYIVTVGGQERQTTGKDKRSGAVGDIDHIAQVCVIAVNDAGHSDRSCMMYQPTDNSLPLKAGLIGGALGFLLLLLLAVLLWRHRKQETSIPMHNTAERQ